MSISLYEQIIAHAEHNPQQTAILAPERTALSYSALAEQSRYVIDYLNNRGIGRKTRIALILPNGPDAASAFIAVIACAVAAPLNPAYTEAEWIKILRELRIEAVISTPEFTTPVTVAQNLGIQVIYLLARDPAGHFELCGGVMKDCHTPGPASAEEPAFVLQTTGSTSAPKIVPITHRNLAVRAQQGRQSLCVSEKDRCLNIMPLFHAHGLTNGLCTPLAAGAGIICLPGLEMSIFCQCLRELGPTYYSASVTHQRAILAWLAPRREMVSGHRLRVIRWSTGPLEAGLQAELEQIFDAPLVHNYGSTETGNISGNPLPPRIRKSGTVGISSGSEIVIMDEQQCALDAFQTGEVWVRGPAVFAGYDRNPQATEAAFVDGWFRTGDLGFFDEEGYLTLRGRIKDMISRGGQKVSPHEVDLALQNHADVVESYTFPVPHRTLGEEVGAAVVLRAGAANNPDEPALQAFLRTRLADFKVPTRFVFSAQIPKTANGKVQRRRLAEHFGLGVHIAQDYEPPQDEMERRIAAIWASVLGLPRVGRNSEFVALGGNSLLAMQVFARIEQCMKIKLPLALLLQAPTIAQLAQALHYEEAASQWSSLVTIQSRGARPPLYCVPGVGGNVLEFGLLARYMAPEQPIYGLQAQGLDGKTPPYSSVEEMAAHYLDEIRSLQPQGPYFLAGYSFGGKVALEMAQQLLGQGHAVALLAILDTTLQRDKAEKNLSAELKNYLNQIAHPPANKYAEDIRLWIRALISPLYVPLKRIAYKTCLCLGRDLPHKLSTLHVFDTSLKASRRYAPKLYPGKIIYFSTDTAGKREMAWRLIAGQGIKVYSHTGGHFFLNQEDQARLLAERLTICIDKASKQITP